MVGKAGGRGRWMPVERVIGHLAETPDLEDLFEAHPELTGGVDTACCRFAQSGVALS